MRRSILSNEERWSFTSYVRFGGWSSAKALQSVSQPALSSQIELLEEEFGLDLFVRNPKGMSLIKLDGYFIPMPLRA